MNSRPYSTPPPGSTSWWRKLATFGAALALFGAGVFAQTANTYIFSYSTGTTLDAMVGATTLPGVSSGNDDAQTSVTNLGFNFTYEGAVYSTFSANSNGVLMLGGSVGTAYINTGAFGPATMCILWDERDTVRDQRPPRVPHWRGRFQPQPELRYSLQFDADLVVRRHEHDRVPLWYEQLGKLW
jgi:hypothetical protein